MPTEKARGWLSGIDHAGFVLDGSGQKAPGLVGVLPLLVADGISSDPIDQLVVGSGPAHAVVDRLLVQSLGGGHVEGQPELVHRPLFLEVEERFVEVRPLRVERSVQEVDAAPVIEAGGHPPASPRVAYFRATYMTSVVRQFF